MKNILIIDDEIEICKTLDTLLSMDGFQVTWTTNPLEALSLIEAKNPDCVLLDMIMPGEDGLEVLGKIKKLDKTLPVVILTACDQLKRAVLAMKNGAFHYLAKPFDSEELTIILAKAMEQRGMALQIKELKERLGETENLESLLGVSAGMREVLV